VIKSPPYTHAVPTRFSLKLQGTANPSAIVEGPRVRFTVLTSRLLRLEYSPEDSFEDRASQAFWYRWQPKPTFQVHRNTQSIEIVTEHLHLRYDISPRGFHRQNLAIDVRETGQTWRYGNRDSANLLGTARTLDEASGAIRLESGLMSRSGWAVVDDSQSLVFNQRSWLEPRRRPNSQDFYFFGYGHDYQGCLADFCKIAGPMPLIPRWMLGNWWSRYWAYSQDELKGLMEEFDTRQVPLSVCIVDMDWHLTETGNACSGWTGYTWNRELFPDPAGFIAWLHATGLRTALNLHPAEGIHPHEEPYEAMARRLSIDPASGEPVPFDIADPAFVEAYYELLHHPLEAQGVDFWWIDWQQGHLTQLPGLDPLWWLNHLHFLDLGRNRRGDLEGIQGNRQAKRPVIFSRWGGLGNHRYPIGFSGDTIVSWDSLAFQPYFTATAANVGYGWWSHDIGGHWGGIEDRELYTRWVQYGVFSPILRLHSTKNPYHERRPWGWDSEVFRVTRDALQLRHALVPYLYSMAWKAATQAVPLCLPMYWLYPEEEAAYRCPNQYCFGSELIAAPFVAPAEADTRLSRQAIWLPAGDWFGFFDGQHWAGGRWHAIYGELADIPVFARAGAIVPLGPMSGRFGTDNPTALALHIFPGADNRCELYEDDGESQAFESGAHCITVFEQYWREDSMVLVVRPVQGDVYLIPARRTYTLVCRGIRLPDAVVATVNGISQEMETAYDSETETLTLSGLILNPADELRVTLSSETETLLSRQDRRDAISRKLLRAFRLNSLVKREIDAALPDLLAGRGDLMIYANRLTAGQLQALQCSIKGTNLGRCTKEGNSSRSDVYHL
jgi:alpha-glucosidase (family GH31 glycosyl hydrolase)